MYITKRAIETGGRLVLLMNRRLKMILLNLAPERRAKNL